MNEFESVTGGQIDRLVDGELSRDERRAVLLALDHEDGGWRRLALAFLESQALRESLGSRSKAAAVVTASPMPAAVVKPQRNWTAAIVMATSAALMFGLGRLSTSDFQDPVQRASQPQIAATYEPPTPDAAATNDNQVLASNVGASVQQQTLRLELGDGQGGPTQAVEVPMVENSNIGLEDLLAAPPVISDRVQRELLRSGKRVYEQRQLYEVTLEDGRRGVVPVSNVYVENAGLDVYQ